MVDFDWLSSLVWHVGLWLKIRGPNPTLRLSPASTGVDRRILSFTTTFHVREWPTELIEQAATSINLYCGVIAGCRYAMR